MWQSYDVDDIMFFLTGQRNIPDFSQYLRVPNLPQQKEIFHNPPPLTPEIEIANGNEQFSTPPPSPSTDSEEFHTPNNSSQVQNVPILMFSNMFLAISDKKIFCHKMPVEYPNLHKGFNSNFSF